MPKKTTQKEHGKKTAPPSEKEVQPEVVIQIPLAELHPFPDHPFQVRDDDSMRETAESVKAYGVLVPAIVRPREEGGYEIIAGHRRKHACELADLATMPAIVRNMDRDTATIIMVDSNLQRENILPSERAKAYKMKLEAIKRQAGRPSKNSVQVGQNYEGTPEMFMRVNGKLIVLPMEEEKPKAKKPSVLQKLNDMKGMESSTGVKKPHVKEER